MRKVTIAAVLALTALLDARPAAAFGCTDQARMLADSLGLGGQAVGGASSGALQLDREFQSAVAADGQSPAQAAATAALARGEEGDENGCLALLEEARRLSGASN